MDELRDAYRGITLIIIVLMIPFTLALIEVSGFILSLFGHNFAVYGKTAFLILTFGCVADAIAGPAGAVLRLTRHSRLSLGINTILTIVYVGLSLTLVQRYGLLGVAIAKSFVLVLANWANLIANYFLMRIFPYSWKHAQLLGLGVLILTGASIAHRSGIGTMAHFFFAIGEITVFAGVASLVVRSQIKRAIEIIRGGGYLLDSADYKL